MEGGAKSFSVGSTCSYGLDRSVGAITGDVVLDGGSGMKRAGIGDAEAALDTGIGDAVFERGRGIDSAGIGDVG